MTRHAPSSSPVVTLSYVDPGYSSIAGFANHLNAYSPLFRELNEFRFLLISNSAVHFARCGEMLLLGRKGTDFNRDCGGCSAVLPSSESVGPEEVRPVLEQRDRVVERCNTPVPRRPLRLSPRGLVLGTNSQTMTCAVSFHQPTPNRKAEFQTFLVQRQSSRGWCCVEDAEALFSTRLQEQRFRASALG